MQHDRFAPITGKERPLPRRHRAITLDSIAALILTIGMFLCLLRGTMMWYDYPTTQGQNASVDPWPMQLLLYSLLPFSLLYILLDHRRVLDRLRHPSPLVLAFLFCLTFSVLLSVDLQASLRGFAALMCLSLPPLLYAWRFGERSVFAMLRWFAVFAILANLAFTLISPNGTMTDEHAGAMRGMFLSKNSFGSFAAVCFLLLLPTRTEWDVRNLWRLGMAALAFACAIASRSSTALIVTCVGLAAVTMLDVVGRVSSRAFRSIGVVALTICLIALIGLLGMVVLDTVSSYFGKDITMSGRTELWAALWKHAFDYPLTGHGYAMFRQTDYFREMAQEIEWGPRSTHNSYLETLLEIGLPGTLCWFAFLFSHLFRRIVRLPTERQAESIRHRLTAVVMMILFVSLTEAAQMLSPNSVMWPIMLAILAAPLARHKMWETRPKRKGPLYPRKTDVAILVR